MKHHIDYISDLTTHNFKMNLIAKDSLTNRYILIVAETVSYVCNYILSIYLVSKHSTEAPLDRQHTAQEMALYTVYCEYIRILCISTAEYLFPPNS